jgi:hypothetical protein
MLKLCWRCAWPPLMMGLIAFFAAPASAAEYLAADRANDQIVAFDAATGAVTRVVADAADGIDGPAAIALDPDNNILFVANVSLGNVLAIDLETNESSVFADSIYGPGGLAWDAATSTLFVGEFGNFDGELIKQYDAQGMVVGTYGAGTGATGRSGLALRNGDLYASSFSNAALGGLGAVLKFAGPSFANPAGPFAMSSAPPMAAANGLTFDAAGDLYVAGLGTQNILKFDVDESGAVVGASQFGPTSIAYPAGLLYIDEGPQGALLVTSLGNDNPMDPIYGNFLFPGGVFKFDIATGAAKPFLVGDYDGNLQVDGEDLAAWTTAFEMMNSDGDADGDGDSDGDDFLAWQRTVGNHGVQGAFQPTGIVLYDPASAGAATVPEPAAAMLLAIAVASVAGRRSSRRGR